MLALNKIGASGKVFLCDISDEMLAIAKQRIAEVGAGEQVEFRSGDILNLPSDDNSFDAVVSTYSMCPVYDPALGAKELYGVTTPGGHIGVAHSTKPGNPYVRWLADRVEDAVWYIASTYLGWRAVSVSATRLNSSAAKSASKSVVKCPYGRSWCSWRKSRRPDRAFRRR